MCSINRPAAADAVNALASCCDALAARDLDALGEARLRADVEALTRVAARVAAERLRCVAVVARRAPDAAAGAEQAQQLLRTAGRLSGGQAASQTRLATALADPGLQVTAAALAAGRISPGQADALAQAARTHPQLVAVAQDELVAQASECDDRAFREALADRRHAADPGPEEDRACRQYAARRFALFPLPDGMRQTDGLLDPSGAALLATALDALAGPDPATVPDECRRTREQRMADALVELARRALARNDDLPTVAGLQPRATVFVTPETLAEEPDAPAARLDWAGVICGATARRIACDADVVRRQVTRDGRTVWLDVRRHPSPAQRLAVIERDRTCRFTGSDGTRCQRPWQWCDIHRPRQPPPPARPKGGDGGPTLIPNLALLCTAHHHVVHEGGWWVTGDADATLTFHPPLGWPHHQPRPRPARPTRPAPRTAPPARPPAIHHPGSNRGPRDPDPPQLVLIE
ncbi:MAG: DUF222 domain-containing protein [Egibacteraceae bacterium]